MLPPPGKFDRETRSWIPLYRTSHLDEVPVSLLQSTQWTLSGILKFCHGQDGDGITYQPPIRDDKTPHSPSLPQAICNPCRS